MQFLSKVMKSKITLTMLLKIFVVTYLLNNYICAGNVSQVCTDGALYFDESCFKLVSQAKSWSEADKYCHDVYGGHMAISDTTAIFNKLNTMAHQHNAGYIWLGANDNDHNNVFEWVNGRRCCPNFWIPGQPDNSGGNQRCLGLWWQKKHDIIGFDDGDCGVNFAFVCQSVFPACQSIPYCRSQTCFSDMTSKCSTCENGYFPVKNSSSCFDLTSSRHKRCFRSCLVVFTQGLSWENAKSICNERGGQLYVPSSSDEDSSLTNYLEAVVGSYENFWVGGQLLKTSQEKWLGNISPTHVRWGSVPTSLKEDKCIAIARRESYRLGTFSCDQTFPFVCQETTLYNPSPIG